MRFETSIASIGNLPALDVIDFIRSKWKPTQIQSIGGTFLLFSQQQHRLMRPAHLSTRLINQDRIRHPAPTQPFVEREQRSLAQQRAQIRPQALENYLIGRLDRRAADPGSLVRFRRHHGPEAAHQDRGIIQPRQAGENVRESDKFAVTVSVKAEAHVVLVLPGESPDDLLVPGKEFPVPRRDFRIFRPGRMSMATREDFDPKGHDPVSS
ncbi:MAG TPA: hypothetical protein VLS27_01675 [Gammaproteobacteria bacterium]|nr:hypothetical protein [Gammaproteobacteria bacterium]